MNLAEREMLTFLDANDVITPLPHAQNYMLLNVKLFSCYMKKQQEPVEVFQQISLYQRVPSNLPRH